VYKRGCEWAGTHRNGLLVGILPPERRSCSVLTCEHVSLYFLWTKIKIAITRCHILRQKCTKIDFFGDCDSLQTHWGSLQCSPTPPDLAGFKRPYWVSLTRLTRLFGKKISTHTHTRHPDYLSRASQHARSATKNRSREQNHAPFRGDLSSLWPDLIYSPFVQSLRALASAIPEIRMGHPKFKTCHVT